MTKAPNAGNPVLPLPFPVREAPPSRPLAGLLVAALARLVILWSMVGHGALFGAIGAASVFPLFSSGLLDAYPADSQPITTGQFLQILLFVAVFGVAGLLLGPVGKRLLYHGRKLRTRNALAVLEKDPRPPVLYLRAFDDDALDDPTLVGPLEWRQQRYEERLAKSLSRLGPVICIGTPGEKASEAGAARIYVDDPDWQRAIRHFMHQSAAIVILVGSSAGLHWEIETALAEIPRSRLLFFFPYVRSRSVPESLSQRLQMLAFRGKIPKSVYLQMDQERRARYEDFRTRYGTSVAAALPSDLGTEQFLHFGMQGEAKFLKVRRPLISAGARYIQKAFTMHISFRKSIKPFINKINDLKH